MKKYMIISILIFFTSTLFSQENVKNKRDSKEINGTQKVLAPQANGDEVIIKDNVGNSLIKITDEGTFGSITLPDSTGAPGIVTNKLYNVNGTLNFNGTALGATGAMQINDLSDAKYDGESLFLGQFAGFNDDAGASDGNKNYNTAIGKNALSSNTNGKYNTATGYAALTSNTTGDYNTANGIFALYSNIDATSNTAIGHSTLYSNTTGKSNTATGRLALSSNTIGNYNTATGHKTLQSNTIGSYNTAIGFESLFSNTTGNDNTATGRSSLYSNIDGKSNTATGRAALYSNINGNSNTANGKNTLFYNTNGSYNTAIGFEVLFSNTTGSYNTACGNSALYSNTIGNYNVCIGRNANFYNQEGYYNTIIGYRAGSGTALHNKSGNIFLGYKAGFYETGNNKLYIQNDSSTTPLIGGDFAVNEVYLNGRVGIGTTNPFYKLHVIDNGGAREVAFFHNTDKGIDSDGIIVRAGPDVNPGGGIDYIIFQDGNGTTVGVIDGNGFGGINYNTTSDRRLKTKIKDYTGALDKINKIQVRKYVRKTNLNKEEIGFIAQELQKVYPQAVSGSPDNDVETDPMMVDYSSITPLLVRAIQEQQDRIKTQDVRIKNLEEENRKIRIQNAEISNQNEELKKQFEINSDLETKIKLLEQAFTELLKNQQNIKLSSK